MLIVDIKNKSFGRKIIFKDFYYAFEDRGLYIIKGASGAGKTTLFRMISGLDRDFDGEIKNGGFSNTSYQFQEYRLFDQLNAIENVNQISFKIQNQKSLESSRALLSRLGFTDDEMKLYPKELSGGMKQRVAFARAVLRESPILLLDEPTKELDPLLTNEMCDIINEEAKKRTVILITHIDHTSMLPSYTTITI